MKILVSGFTALQIGSQKRQIQKIDVPAAFVKTLREAGHEVEWRKVWCKEEDFSNYDLMIACVAPATSPNATSGLGVMKAMNQIKNIIVFYDDWKLSDVGGAFKVLSEKGEKQFRKTWSNGNSFYHDEIEDIIASKEDIMKVAKDLTERGRSTWKILCPMFEWGNKDIITKFIPWLTKENFNYIDPTPAVIDLNMIPQPSQIEKAWVIASISDQTRWIKKQGIKWPVHYYGCRKLKCERLKTEKDVFQKYSEHYGVLSPAYPSSGSGWFRARYVYAALANAYLWCGDKDAEILGQPYQIPPSLVELYNEQELVELANNQKDCLFKHLTTMKEFKEKLSNIIKF
jgi:hypothetical protein